MGVFLTAQESRAFSERSFVLSFRTVPGITIFQAMLPPPFLSLAAAAIPRRIAGVSFLPCRFLLKLAAHRGRARHAHAAALPPPEGAGDAQRRRRSRGRRWDRRPGTEQGKAAHLCSTEHSNRRHEATTSLGTPARSDVVACS